MDVLISIIGIVFQLSPSFMAFTFNAVSAATADFISYAHLAEHGFGKMAFGAIVGGSVFSKLATKLRSYFLTLMSKVYLCREYFIYILNL